MMYNDLYPILNDHGELAPARRLSVASGAAEVMSQEEGVAAEGKEKQVEEEEGLMNEAIKVLKEKMLDVCDHVPYLHPSLILVSLCWAD